MLTVEAHSDFFPASSQKRDLDRNNNYYFNQCLGAAIRLTKPGHLCVHHEGGDILHLSPHHEAQQEQLR